jgi:hypothetical protein
VMPFNPRSPARGGVALVAHCPSTPSNERDWNTAATPTARPGSAQALTPACLAEQATSLHQPHLPAVDVKLFKRDFSSSLKAAERP